MSLIRRLRTGPPFRSAANHHETFINGILAFLHQAYMYRVFLQVPRPPSMFSGKNPVRPCRSNLPRGTSPNYRPRFQMKWKQFRLIKRRHCHEYRAYKDIASLRLGARTIPLRAPNFEDAALSVHRLPKQRARPTRNPLPFGGYPLKL